MNTVLYHDVNTLELPDAIKKSLSDDFEFSYVHKIEDTTYFILNYPKTNNLLNVICLSYNSIEGFNIYAYDDHQPNFDNIHTVSDLIYDILNHYKELMDEINSNITDYESQIDQLINKKYILKLYDDKKDIINYESTIDSIKDVMNFIIESKPAVIYDEKYDALYKTIQIEINQIYKKMNVTMQTIDSIQTISESMHAHKLTETMKYLKLITLLFSVPGFFTTIYSTKILPLSIMNTILPYLIGVYVILTIFTIYHIFRD